jgi:hypothetical protein
MRDTYSKISVQTPEQRRPLESLRHWQEGNTESDFTDVGHDRLDWNNLAQTMTQCGATGARVPRIF